MTGLDVAVRAKTEGRGPELVDRKHTAWREAAHTLEETTGLVAVTCDQETYSTFLDFGHVPSRLLWNYTQNPNTHGDWKEELATLRETARTAIRKELRIEALN